MKAKGKKIAAGSAERRCYTGQEFRAITLDDGGKVIEGHAAVYNRATVIHGYFQEIIEPGAFDGADMTDVPLIVNHDTRKLPLARSRRNNGNSTMKLATDEKGLLITARVDTENNAEAQQLYSAIERGDIDGMSFAFTVDKEEWENLESDMPTRRIKAFAKIFEVSAVTWPAYQETDINARADVDALESAKRALENARAKVTPAPDSAARQAAEAAREIEIYRLKNGILAGGI